MTKSHKNPAAVALGKLGGSVKSERKAKTSAENGRKRKKKKDALNPNRVELKQRVGEPTGYYMATKYYMDVPIAIYSVVDFGTTMRKNPIPVGVFVGWEAIKIDQNGRLITDGNYTLRHDSWEQLEQIL